MSEKRSARWGGVVLDDVQVNTGHGQSFVRHVPARGNGGYLEHSGAELREWRITVRWTRRGSGDDPEARYQQLLAKNDGQTRLLRLAGQPAVPTRMSIESEDRSSGQPDVVLLFVEDRGDTAGDHAPAVNVATAMQTVHERALAAESVLTAAALPTDIAADSAALAQSWRASNDTRTADSADGFSRQRDAVEAALTAPATAADSSQLDAYFAMVDLSAALTDAIDAVQSETVAGLVALQLDEPVTVLALAASMYGPAVAEQRVADIVRINQLRSANAVAPAALLVPGAT